MPENIDLIIFQLEEIDSAIREFLRLYDREDEYAEKQLETVLMRIRYAALSYCNLMQYFSDLEARSLRELNLCKLLVPTSLEGGWCYVARSHPQTESKGTRQPSVPDRSKFLPEAE